MLVLSRVFKRTFYSIFGKQTRIDIYYIEGRDLYKNDSNKTSFHPIKLLEQRGKKAREKEIWIHIFAIVRCLSIANTLPNNTRIFLFTCPLSILHNLQKNGGKNNSCYRTTPFDCKFTFIYLSIVDCATWKSNSNSYIFYRYDAFRPQTRFRPFIYLSMQQRK